ncbi:hypothetical protein CROQUDRAFT_35707, partial [Cronartium quercuum f. sp. fusiforme G11]
KWLMYLDRSYQAPMLSKSKGNFYLYVPVQLLSGNIVVPTHFYMCGEGFHAKCLVVEVRDNTTTLGPPFWMSVPQESPWEGWGSVTVKVKNFSQMYNHIIWKIRSLMNLTRPILYREYWAMAFLISWADGQVICHIPIITSCDDASGNRGKRWNKHLCYVNLAGLPSNISNLDYNIHTLAASNVAGALELAEKITDQLKYVILWCAA